MIAADQLVGREVSFSKSGFQFPKGAYRVPTESPPSEFASGVTDRRESFRKRNTTTIRGEIFVLPVRSVLFPFSDGPSMVRRLVRKFKLQILFLVFKFDKVSTYPVILTYRN